MSYFAFLARSLVSATYFSIIGNACKIITIVINSTIWANHASPTGIGCLLISLAGTYFYQQAPMRKEYQVVESNKNGESNEMLPKK